MTVDKQDNGVGCAVDDCLPAAGGEKFAHYRTIESLESYVLVAQDRVLVEHFARQGDVWVLRAADRLDATIELAAIGCELALAGTAR